MKTVRVEAIVSLYIEVPDGTDKEGVYDFLSNHIDWSSHMDGISNEDQTIRVTDSIVVDEEIVTMDYEND